jgi:hypothetical protein
MGLIFRWMSSNGSGRERETRVPAGCMVLYGPSTFLRDHDRSDSDHMPLAHLQGPGILMPGHRRNEARQPPCEMIVGEEGTSGTRHRALHRWFPSRLRKQTAFVTGRQRIEVRRDRLGRGSRRTGEKARVQGRPDIPLAQPQAPNSPVVLGGGLQCACPSGMTTPPRGRTVRQ